MTEVLKTDDGVTVTVNGIGVLISGPSNLLGRLCTDTHMAKLATVARPTKCVASWKGNGARTIEVKATVGGVAAEFKDQVIGWLEREGLRFTERRT